MQLTSQAFDPNARIPDPYTAEGQDVSPPLSWQDAPPGTQSFALICDDPDAPIAEPFVHWVIYNIPDGTTSLPEGVAKVERPGQPTGAAQGTNSFGKTGYGGPAPPPGHGVHHYHFKLYALDAPLDLTPGATKADVLGAMQGNVLGEAELIGTYSR